MDAQKMQRLRNIYDSFAVKDMSFEAFVGEHEAVTKPYSPGEIATAQLAKAQVDSAGIRQQRKEIITVN